MSGSDVRSALHLQLMSEGKSLPIVGHPAELDAAQVPVGDPDRDVTERFSRRFSPGRHVERSVSQVNARLARRHCELGASGASMGNAQHRCLLVQLFACVPPVKSSNYPEEAAVFVERQRVARYWLAHRTSSDRVV